MTIAAPQDRALKFARNAEALYAHRRARTNSGAFAREPLTQATKRGRNLSQWHLHGHGQEGSPKQGRRRGVTRRRKHEKTSQTSQRSLS